LGAGGPRFESGRPDHISCHFIRLAIIALIGQCIFLSAPSIHAGHQMGYDKSSPITAARGPKQEDES